MQTVFAYVNTGDCVINFDLHVVQLFVGYHNPFRRTRYAHIVVSYPYIGSPPLFNFMMVWTVSRLSILSTNWGPTDRRKRYPRR